MENPFGWLFLRVVGTPADASKEARLRWFRRMSYRWELPWLILIVVLVATYFGLGGWWRWALLAAVVAWAYGFMAVSLAIRRGAQTTVPEVIECPLLALLLRANRRSPLVKTRFRSPRGSRTRCGRHLLRAEREHRVWPTCLPLREESGQRREVDERHARSCDGQSGIA